MVEEDFKRIRRKFQGKCFVWDRINKMYFPWTYYSRIKKIVPAEPDVCLVISDRIIIRPGKFIWKNIDARTTCKYKERSFYATFGKRIIPSMYKKKLLEYDKRK